MINTTRKSVLYYGLFGTASLLVVYFAILTLVSGWSFAQDQFLEFWYFILSLATGFGIQLGLYAYLRERVKRGSGTGKVVGVAGATSTATMISCCTHYLVNLLPILGATGVVTLVAQYQVELFWIGIIFNIAGIAYMASRIFKLQRT